MLVLTLNRPEVGNALNPELTGRLIAAMGDADGDPGVREWRRLGRDRS